MRKIAKVDSKKGFSLVEMVAVLVIICILASVMISGGLKILNTVKTLAFGEESPVVAHNEAIK